jgi:penicillin-binding protein 1A
MRMLSIIFGSLTILLFIMLVVISGTIDAIFQQHSLLLNQSGIDTRIANLATYQPPSGTDVKLSDGSELGFIMSGGQNRIWTPISDIPPLVKDSFIAAEDDSFWTNKGVDIAANIRSASQDLQRSASKRPAGASTITQQIIKNNVMNGQVSTIGDKINEFILSLRANQLLTKKHILELYLNQIYLGDQAYGVAAAAKAYFNEPLSDLNVAQSATLAGIPKSPTDYNPLLHPDQSLVRRGYVLNRMLADHMIEHNTYDTAMAAPLLPVTAVDHIRKPDVDQLIPGTGWIKDIISQHVFGSTVQGMTTSSTVDKNMEVAAQISLDTGLMHWDSHIHGWHGTLGHIGGTITPDSLLAFTPSDAPDWSEPAVVVGLLKNGVIEATDANGDSVSIGPSGYAWLGQAPHLSVGDVILVAKLNNTSFQPMIMQIPENGLNGSIVVIDGKDGAIKAIAGGFTYHIGNFDRATQARRQAGSTVKPFIYLTAMELGYTPDTPVLDLPIDIAGGPKNDYWEPTDDDNKSMGIMTTRKALIYSRNMAAVRVLWQVGLDKVSKVTAAFGLYDKLDDYSDALGAKVVTPIKMATAYAELINGGYAVSPHIIDLPSTTDISATKNTSIAPIKAVDDILSILDGVTTEGTASNLDGLAKKIPIGGKTGTSDDFKDAWFAGYANNRLSIVVQIGYDQPESLGKDGFGATVAAPIFQSFVEDRIEEIRALPPLNNGVINSD